jgi:myo-inositol 2-dehydrogenase / D-chiro-inositol 1-dehydrogenase
MKLCLVGCGDHAASSHGPAQAKYAAAHPELVLAGCCDTVEARADAHRARFGFARAWSDVETMLDAEDPDAVVVVVPETATVAVAEAVLRRGLPLLVEKPPGRTVAEVDQLIAAADRGRDGRPVPHQVALNRRFVPLVAELRRRLDARGAGAAPIQHVHYEMTRVDRRDRDFSVTAIHGIDAVRYLAGSDYAHVRFRYRELPELGEGVANVFMDAVMASGATTHLAFCPVAGVSVERAVVHAHGETFFLHVPMWGAFDSPGLLLQLQNGRVASRLMGDELTPDAKPFELGGFLAELEAFLGALARGEAPQPSLREARQSVAVAEHIRSRRPEFTA